MSDGKLDINYTTHDISENFKKLCIELHVDISFIFPNCVTDEKYSINQ